MALCVMCFIMLTVRRLQLAKMTIKSTNYANSSLRHVMGIFEKKNKFFFLNDVRCSNYFMRLMRLFTKRLI